MSQQNTERKETITLNYLLSKRRDKDKVNIGSTLLAKDSLAIPLLDGRQTINTALGVFKSHKQALLQIPPTKDRKAHRLQVLSSLPGIGKVPCYQRKKKNN